MAEKEATSSVKSPIAGSTSQNNDDELYLNTSDAFTSIPGSSMHIDGEVESIAGTFGTSPWSQSSGPTLISGPPLNPLSVPPGDQTSDVPLHFGPTSNQSQVSLSTVPLYQPSSLSSIMSLSGSSHWPNESIATGLIDSYFQSWHPVMPIIDKQLILTWLMELSTHPSPGHQQQQSPSSGWSQFTPGAQKSTHVPSELICAVFASALPYSSLDSQQQQAHQLSVGSFISQAENFLAASGKIGHPSLHTVQTHVLLSFSCLGLGDYSRASRHFGQSSQKTSESRLICVHLSCVFVRCTGHGSAPTSFISLRHPGHSGFLSQDLV